MMPEMDGFAVVAALQKEVQLTGHSDHRHHRTGSRRQRPRATEFRCPIGVSEGKISTGRPGRAHPPAQQAGNSQRDFLLKADVSEAGKGWSDNRIIEALETSPSMVYRVRKQLVEEGLLPCSRWRGRPTGIRGYSRSNSQ
jgi:hypothetical protein